MRHLVTRTATALALGLVLVGCGSDGAEDSSESSPTAEPEQTSDAAGSDVTTLTLTDEPFCDSVDTGTVGDLLGIPAAQVKVITERDVGEKYTSFPGGPKETSPSNICVLGTQETSLGVSVSPSGSEATLMQSLETYRAMDDPNSGSSDVCTVTEDETLGSPGAVVTCEGVMQGVKGRAMVLVKGVLEGGEYACQAVVAKGTTPEQLEDPARETCLELLETVLAG